MNLLIRNAANPIMPRRVDLFGELSKEVDRVMNEVFGAPYFNGMPKRGKGYPLVDAVRTPDKLVLQYTVPGVKLEDLAVETEEDENGQLLTVKGRLSSDYTHDDASYQIRELSGQEFRRVLRLPDDVSNNEPKASLKDGILTLTFDVISLEEPKPKVKRLNITQE